MLAKFSGLNPKAPYLSLEKEKEYFWVVLTYSIKRAREIRKFHVAVVQQRLRNAQKRVMHVQSCLLFAVAVAETPCCSDPEILLPWQRNVTILLSIRTCDESVQIGHLH